MDRINFFVVSAGQPDEEYSEVNFKRIVDNNAFVLHKHTQQKGSYFDIKPGDILILKHKWNFVAYGKVKRQYIGEEEEFNHWASVEEWVFHDYENIENGIPRKGIDKATIAGGKYGTVKTVKPEFALNKMAAINPATSLYKYAKNSINLSEAQMEKQEIVKVLEYKKQIILQGPPGTGKTYTAELIAKELTEVETISNPLELLNGFFKNFDAGDSNVIKEREERSRLRERFLSTFPKEKLKELTLEQYCIGTGERDNFCWWIELGLKPLGYYFPGSARSYRIYWSKGQDGYVKNGDLLKIDDDNQAMAVVADQLDNIVVKRDWEEASKFFGPSFILKVLNSYFPEEFMPINAVNYITNALDLFGIEHAGKNFIELNQQLLALNFEKNKEFGSDVKPHEFMRFLVDNFNLKEGERINQDKIVAKGTYELVQFHPAYSYEDFVRGIDAEILDGKPSFNVNNKTLIQFAERAIDNPKANFVLIIDEINRANLPAVLGELIYALEYRGRPVNSLYELENSRTIQLPGNLYIIGTMNTADRSVGHIDYAIRRRFSFINMLPDESCVPDFAKDKFNRVKALFESDLLAPDFKKEDVQIGHSYFMAETPEELDVKLKFEVLPILKEYVKDGVLLSDAAGVIEQL